MPGCHPCSTVTKHIGLKGWGLKTQAQFPLSPQKVCETLGKVLWAIPRDFPVPEEMPKVWLDKTSANLIVGST